MPDKKVYINLDKYFKEKLLFSAKGNGSWQSFKHKQINPQILDSFRRKQRVSLGVIWKLIECANRNGIIITPEDVEKHTILIGGHQSSIIFPKLPFRFDNPAGAKIIAAVLHDGGIRERYAAFYCNNSSKKRKEVCKAINDVLGTIMVKNKEAITVEFITIVGFILVYGIGLKPGNKVINNPTIPEFISNLNEKSIASYLQQAFDDDGYVCKGRRNNHKLVGITCNTADISNPPSPHLLIGIKRLLDKMNIPSETIHKSKLTNIKGKYLSREWKLIIAGRYSIEKFKELVNFGLEYKKEGLLQIIKDLKNISIRFQKPWALSEKEAKTIVQKTCKERGYINKYVLAHTMSFSPHWTKVLLKRLETKKYIRRLDREKNTEPLRYNLREL